MDRSSSVGRMRSVIYPRPRAGTHARDSLIDMQLRQITNRIYYTEGFLETDRPVLGLIRGTNRTLMVDAGNSPRHAREFLHVLDVNRLPVPDLIAITHAHCD